MPKHNEIPEDRRVVVTIFTQNPDGPKGPKGVPIIYNTDGIRESERLRKWIQKHQGKYLFD